MAKVNTKTKDGEMREEYDFSGGIRGKYAKRFAKGCNVVVLEPDIAERFKTSKAVNKALRKVMESESRPRP